MAAQKRSDLKWPTVSSQVSFPVTADLGAWLTISQNALRNTRAMQTEGTKLNDLHVRITWRLS
jgi:hypothetical protein